MTGCFILGSNVSANFVTVDIFWQKIQGLHELRGLVKLYLYGNNITTIQGLATLTNLEILWLNTNKITVIQVSLYLLQCVSQVLFFVFIINIIIHYFRLSTSYVSLV